MEDNNQNNYHETRHSPGKGNGVFARTAIPEGTRIWAESALLAVQDSSTLAIYEAYLTFCRAHPQDIGLYHSLVSNGRAAASYFYPSGTKAIGVKTKWLAIMTQIHWENWKGRFPDMDDRGIDVAVKVVTIFDNNYFYTETGSNGIRSRAVFSSAALLNHSCIPNCYASWNSKLQKLCVHAVRDIHAGEELLITYGESEMMFANRQTRLKLLHDRYPFTCTCPACYNFVQWDGSTAAKREEIAVEHGRIQNSLPESAPHEVVETRITTMERVISLIEGERLNTWSKGKLHMALARLYGWRWRFPEARDQYGKAKAIALICFGDDHEQTQEAVNAWEAVDSQLMATTSQ